jgi:hypothetical protein
MTLPQCGFTSQIISAKKGKIQDAKTLQTVPSGVP